MADKLDVLRDSSNMSYKQAHEHFVSNLNGTSMSDIAIIVSSAPIAVLLRTFLLAFIAKYCCHRHGQTSVRGRGQLLKIWAIFLLDNSTLVLPLVLAVTVLADHAVALNITLLLISATCLFSSSLQRSNTIQPSTKYKEALDFKLPKKLPFISNYRVYVVSATAIGILAVDFAVFPRRLAKTETYGTGLMDVGVGAFMFSNAIVSHEAKGGETESHIGAVRATLKSFRSSLPLFVLGVLRCVSVKSTEYQEHVSEYGMHWNFFFTLFCIRVFSAGIVSIIHNTDYLGAVGAVLVCVYQYLLSHAGLKELILHGNKGDGSRTGLIDANREGLCSCIGYLALYFLSVHVGRFLFNKRDTVRSWLYALLVLAVADGLFWVLTAASQHYISPVSRRLCNLSFVLWQMAYNLQLLASFLLCDVIVSLSRSLALVEVPGAAGCSACYPDDYNQASKRGKRDKTSHLQDCTCLIAAINRNQLMYFLLANVLTGLVNFSVKTIHCTALEGFTVMCIYMLTVNAVVVILHRYEITFKFR